MFRGSQSNGSNSVLKQQQQQQQKRRIGTVTARRTASFNSLAFVGGVIVAVMIISSLIFMFLISPPSPNPNSRQLYRTESRQRAQMRRKSLPEHHRKEKNPFDNIFTENSIDQQAYSTKHQRKTTVAVENLQSESGSRKSLISETFKPTIRPVRRKSLFSSKDNSTLGIDIKEKREYMNKDDVERKLKSLERAGLAAPTTARFPTVKTRIQGKQVKASKTLGKPKNQKRQQDLTEQRQLHADYEDLLQKQYQEQTNRSPSTAFVDDIPVKASKPLGQPKNQKWEQNLAEQRQKHTDYQDLSRNQAHVQTNRRQSDHLVNKIPAKASKPSDKANNRLREADLAEQHQQHLAYKILPQKHHHEQTNRRPPDNFVNKIPVKASKLSGKPRTRQAEQRQKRTVSENLPNELDKEQSSRQFVHPLNKDASINLPPPDRNKRKSLTVEEPHQIDQQQLKSQEHEPKQHVLKAFLEPIDMSSWDVKPLPTRSTATADQLTEIQYPKLNSCSKLPEQWPVDDYPNADPFLPWIYDIFPTHDGRFIQFVAQNKRRCRTDINNTSENRILKSMQPQISVFQHVPVKRLGLLSDAASSADGEVRYRLASHADADSDGAATRFICRFKPSMKETLSVFNFDYELVSFRKGNKQMFSETGMDNKNFFTSQLIFRCPVPEDLTEIVRKGSSVIDDWASLFLDLIPIRTPPRYGPPNSFLPPWYKHMEIAKTTARFDPDKEWGDNHILPKIEDSGRWENIPICKPSLMTYEPELAQNLSAGLVANQTKNGDEKVHKLVLCVWASASFATRGDRFMVNDGQRRLNEWIHYNLMVGFDHIYVYDNSGAFSDDISLQPVTDAFSSNHVTRIVWPSQICNNRINTQGERSSQYAAESSCRLRFGPHVEWIGSFDTDEYIVPVGKYTSVLQLLDQLDHEEKKIISFPSFRSWARRSYIETPVVDKNITPCWPPGTCFNLRVPEDSTILQAYNCERQKGRKLIAMPAEKQIYRPDYVKQHFVHYSTVTDHYLLNITQWNEQYGNKKKWSSRIYSDPFARFGDEVNEATMLHTKTIATPDTAGWPSYCRTEYKGRKYCRIGFPWPHGADKTSQSTKYHNITADKDGWKYNCYVNEKIENYWVPRLEKAMRKKGDVAFERKY